MSIAIIDFGMGNLTNLLNAYQYLGLNAYITSNIQQIQKSDKIILCGAAKFKKAISFLKMSGLDTVIKQHAQKGKYLLGICLGHQLFFRRCFQESVCEGLGLIKGDVINLKNQDSKTKHIGWNSINIKPAPIFKDIPNKLNVYFAHSYYAKCHSRFVIARCEHSGQSFAATVQKGNIIGLQFHPEKSGYEGLKILKNFGEL
jgi:glutamine amidotransferase